MKKTIPQPAIIRISSLYQMLGRLMQEGTFKISSTKLEGLMGVPAHTIRKDISYIGEVGNGGGGYEVIKLREHIGDFCGFAKEQKGCIVGLGHIGLALLQSNLSGGDPFKIIAGFDSNINKLETIQTTIDLYPSYTIIDIVKKREIEVAIIAVPAAQAQEVADRLVAGGIKGIVNFAPITLKPGKAQVFIRNIDIAVEFRVLSALANLSAGIIEQDQPQ